MKWILNKQKGTVINHPKLGKLEGGVAYEVSDEDAGMMKHIINIIVFDDVRKQENGSDDT